MPETAVGTFGPEAVDLSAGAGFQADDWQQDGADILLSYRKGQRRGNRIISRWACRNYCDWVPRQNGKGGLGYIRVTFGLFELKEKLMVWSAHESRTALEAMRFLEEWWMNYDDFRRRIKRVMHSKGEEGFETVTGERLRFFARTTGAGRGFSGDYNQIDETFAYTFEQQAAAKPTLSARDNPQTCYTSTPPLDGVGPEGEVMWKLRDSVEPADKDSGKATILDLGALPKNLGYRDFGIGDIDIEREMRLARMTPSMCRADDPKAWAEHNPAYPHRVDDEAIEDERTSMGLAQFFRERMGAWPVRLNQGELPAIDIELWNALADPKSRRASDVALFVDIPPLGDRAAIGLYGPREDGLGHLQVIDYDQGHDWVIPRLIERRAEFGRDLIGIGLDHGGNADKLIGADLVDTFGEPEDPEKPERGQICRHYAGDVAAGVAQILVALRDRTYRHPGQPPLDLAAENASLRAIGDGVGWARRVRITKDGKKLPTVDISSLIAGTGARRTFTMWIDKVRDTYDPLDNIW
jgi:hypothetical protein